MLRIRRLKIKLLFIQLLTIIPFLIFIFYLFDLWYDARRAQIFEKNINEARLIAELIRNETDYAMSISLILAKDTNLYKYLANDKEKAHKMLQNITDTAKEINNIVITDNIGKPISASFDITPEQEQVTLTDRDYFQEMLKDKNTVMSRQVKGRFSQKNVIIMAAPIVVNDQVVAAVLTTYDLEFIKGKIENTSSLKSDNRDDRLIFVIENDGKLSFQLNKPFPKDSDRISLSDKTYVKPALDGKTVLIDNQSLPPFLTNKVIGASIPVDKIGWVVVSAEPINVLFAPIFKMQSICWLIIISSLFFSVMISSYLLRKIKIIY